MSEQANPRLQAALLRAQRQRHQRLEALRRRRELVRALGDAMPRTWRDWLGFAACSAFGLLCILGLLAVLSWWGMLLW